MGKKGCPYCEFNWDKMCEICALTKQPTGDAVMCDFGYDVECAEYKKAKPKKSKKSRK